MKGFNTAASTKSTKQEAIELKIRQQNLSEEFSLFPTKTKQGTRSISLPQLSDGTCPEQITC